jgi:uncharacterized membrane protein YcaP (DUF421 family)
MEEILGPDSTEILWWQMAIRGVLIFIITLILIRLGDRRIFGKNSAFDIVLGLILGGILSRGITGNAPFFPAVFTAFLLVGMHWLLSVMAFKSKAFGHLIKGHETQLVENGQMNHDKLAKTKITENDLKEALRLSKMEEISAADKIYIERNGSLSIIPKKEDS